MKYRVEKKEKESKWPRISGQMYATIVVLILCMTMVYNLGYMAGADGPTGFGTVIEPGSMVEPPSTIIFNDAGICYAKNGTTGSIEYSDSNATHVFQYAVDKCGWVQVLDGTYLVLNVSVEEDFVKIVGNGRNTIVKIPNGVSEANYKLFNVTGNAVELRDIQLDGNRDNQGAYVLSPALVNTNGQWGFILDNVYLHHSMGDGFEGSGMQFTIKNCEICYNREHDIHLNNVFYALLDGNWIYGGSSALLTDDHGGATQITVTNNKFNNSFAGTAAIYLSEDSVKKTKWVISNNIFESNSRDIIISNHSDIIVSNNIFRNAQVYSIISNAYSSRVQITNNEFDSTNGRIYLDGSNHIFSGNLVNYTTFSGLEIYGTKHQINNNYIRAGTGTYNPVILGATYTTISDNRINKIYSPPYCISETGSADYNLIIGNDFRPTPSTAVLNVIGLHDEVRYNIGYVTEISNATTITGAVNLVTIDHGLILTPSFVTVTGNNTGIGYYYVTSLSATQFVITFENQPLTSIWKFYWYAQTW